MKKKKRNTKRGARNKKTSGKRSRRASGKSKSSKVRKMKRWFATHKKKRR